MLQAADTKAHQKAQRGPGGGPTYRQLLDGMRAALAKARRGAAVSHEEDLVYAAVIQKFLEQRGRLPDPANAKELAAVDTGFRQIRDRLAGLARHNPSSIPGSRARTPLEQREFVLLRRQVVELARRYAVDRRIWEQRTAPQAVFPTHNKPIRSATNSGVVLDPNDPNKHAQWAALERLNRQKRAPGSQQVLPARLRNEAERVIVKAAIAIDHARATILFNRGVGDEATRRKQFDTKRAAIDATMRELLLGLARKAAKAPPDGRMSYAPEPKPHPARLPNRAPLWRGESRPTYPSTPARSPRHEANMMRAAAAVYRGAWPEHGRSMAGAALHAGRNARQAKLEH